MIVVEIEFRELLNWINWLFFLLLFVSVFSNGFIIVFNIYIEKFEIKVFVR